MSKFVTKVPYFSFEKAPEFLRDEWITSIAAVVNRGIFIRGEQVEKFEIDWASKLGAKYSIGISNGQDGLILALQSLGIKAGDKVIVPAHSFIATHNAIISLGGIPYSVDVDQNGLIDPNLLKLINEDIFAIIAVHLHGQVCRMNDITAWAKKRNIKIIEDASQAHLASHGGQKVGTIGDIGVFSLYPTKNLGALGDAGIVVTNSAEIAEKIFSLSNYGSSKTDKYVHEVFGLNHRLDEIQAAVLNINLNYLEEWNGIRREIARQYFDGIKKNRIEFLQNFNEDYVWHHFCILHPARDLLQKLLRENGVQTEIHYPRVAAIEVEEFSGMKKKKYPKATEISNQTLSLPISQWHSKEEIAFVIEKLNQVLDQI